MIMGVPMAVLSWYASYWAPPGGRLVGDVHRSQTSRFGDPEQAQRRLEQVIDVNREAGFKCHGRVEASEQPPEIFTHCGSVATSTGCKCPGCGVVLTEAMAREWAESRVEGDHE